MTRRIVAALIALLLPLENAAQWHGCALSSDESAPATAAMTMDAAMPMVHGSADGAGTKDHHDRSCDDPRGMRHECQAAAPCGALAFSVPSSLIPPLAIADADRGIWRDQLALRTHARGPEPPPPRS